MPASENPVRKKHAGPANIAIRQFGEEDWSGTWSIIEPVLRAGDSYSFPTDMTAQQARDIWIRQPQATYVATDDAGRILGTYFLKANQPGQGAHVCNCGYIVAETARGRGVASAMCEHSQAEAIRMGFRAMQYNLVVATNEGAVRLWKKHGFDIVGSLPGAFRHPSAGYVDAYVMYKQLVVPA
ncbi:MAG: GNAT family N-acetyltransferase [Woeseiaceae bacterium]|nr:GNAT family N-acetyltransferase [Woeseiaceae bacterium]